MENSSTVFIAIGNSLRADDGIAHRIVERWQTLKPGAFVIQCLQLTPELAAELPKHQTVLFLDADPTTTEPILEPVDESRVSRAFTHVSSPSEIVRLARTLFAFQGRAFQLRLPAQDFSYRESLSAAGSRLADLVCGLI